jgi:hypothetical protein
MKHFHHYMVNALASYAELVASLITPPEPADPAKAAIARSTERALALASTHFSSDDAGKLRKVICAYRGIAVPHVSDVAETGSFIVIEECHNSHDYKCGVAQLVYNGSERQALGLNNEDMFGTGNHFTDGGNDNRNKIRPATADEIREWARMLRSRAANIGDANLTRVHSALARSIKD